MMMHELQIRSWKQEWKEYPGNTVSFSTVDIVAAPGREGVEDYNYHYPSIAYEARSKMSGEVIARTEGRDALDRLFLVITNLERKIPRLSNLK